MTMTCKVGRILGKYDLEGIEDELVSDWKDGDGFRKLAVALNIAVTRKAIERARDDYTLPDEPEYYYDKLTSEEMSETEKRDVAARLSSYGVDVDELESDFVSYQSIRRHLYRCLDLDPDEKANASRSIEAEQKQLVSLTEYAENVTLDTLERLQARGDVELQTPDVAVSIRVRCRDCGASVPANDLESMRQCDCES
jgi:hypothetical protein